MCGIVPDHAHPPYDVFLHTHEWVCLCAIHAGDNSQARTREQTPGIIPSTRTYVPFAVPFAVPLAVICAAYTVGEVALLKPQMNLPPR